MVSGGVGGGRLLQTEVTSHNKKVGDWILARSQAFVGICCHNTSRFVAICRPPLRLQFGTLGSALGSSSGIFVEVFWIVACLGSPVKLESRFVHVPYKPRRRCMGHVGLWACKGDDPIGPYLGTLNLAYWPPGLGACLPGSLPPPGMLACILPYWASVLTLLHIHSCSAR